MGPPFFFLARPFALALLLLVAFARVAATQDIDPEETARYRFGPIRFTPSIALTNVGVDENVFNELENPKSDTTAAVGPTVEWWMHLGKTRISAKTAAKYMFFAKYYTQRGWSNINDVRWEVPMSRITPFVTGTFANSKERVGFEIDSRARVHRLSYGAGTDVRLSGKTSLTASGHRTRIEYDDSEFFGESLASALDRESDEARVGLRVRLTPLTTFVVNASAASDRFLRDSVRDSNTIKVMPGFDFKPFALISGSVFVGYRQFEPRNALLPPYRGLAATIDAGYVFRTVNRIQTQVNRDVTYSYDKNHPYYTLTDLGLTITRRFTRAWEIAARGGRQSWVYVNLRDAAQTQQHIDRARQLGGGLGYYVGDSLRIGFDINHMRRRASALGDHDYATVNFGASVSYGVPR